MADDETVDPYSQCVGVDGQRGVQDLGSFGGIQSVSTPSGINDSGWIAGQSDSGRASAGSFGLGAAQSGHRDAGRAKYAALRNKQRGDHRRRVEGFQDGTVHGFIYSNGVMTDLGPLYVPTAINNTGQLAGIIYPAPGDYNDIRGFITAAGRTKTSGRSAEMSVLPKRSTTKGKSPACHSPAAACSKLSCTRKAAEYATWARLGFGPK